MTLLNSEILFSSFRSQCPVSLQLLILCCRNLLTIPVILAPDRCFSRSTLYFSMTSGPFELLDIMSQIQRFRLNIHCERAVLDDVNQFTYFGSLIPSNGDSSRKTNARICKAMGARAKRYNFWKSRNIPSNIKRKISACVSSTLL